MSVTVSVSDINNMERNQTEYVSNSHNSSSEIKPSELVIPHLHRFPHSIVWTPIPLLTWFFPLIGHMGITCSLGKIYDFAAAYTILEDDMAFGWPTMYYQLDLKNTMGKEAWDKAVFDANEVYKQRVHNLCCDNCHSHVACALNRMKYAGRTNWNMVNVAWTLFRHGRYVSKCHCLTSWFPFLIILSIVLIATTVCLTR